MEKHILEEKVQNTFCNQFNTAPSATVIVPARANIIGEHTDYNEGFVLPFAINRYCVFLGVKKHKSEVVIQSQNYKESRTLTLNKNESTSKDWSRYFSSVIHVLQQHGYAIGGVACVFGSNIPIGAGLSSSSAITCGFIALLNALFSLKIGKREQVSLASEAEHGTGLKGGMMDQFAIVMAEPHHAILLDCQTFSVEQIPVEIPEHQWLFLNSEVQHSLADTDYNLRRQETENAFEKVRQAFPEIKTLRQLSKNLLTIFDEESTEFKRLHYLIKENERVAQLVTALQKEAWQEVGRLLYQGHQGLSKEYEVSCQELDFLVAQAKHYPEILGARMMGGGFGGGVITLVESKNCEAIANEIIAAYQRKFQHGKGKSYLLESVSGIQIQLKQ